MPPVPPPLPLVVDVPGGRTGLGAVLGELAWSWPNTAAVANMKQIPKQTRANRVGKLFIVRDFVWNRRCPSRSVLSDGQIREASPNDQLTTFVVKLLPMFKRPNRKSKQTVRFNDVTLFALQLVSRHLSGHAIPPRQGLAYAPSSLAPGTRARSIDAPHRAGMPRHTPGQANSNPPEHRKDRSSQP